MAVSANPVSITDIRLPSTPEYVDDPKVFAELMIIYTALRCLQVSTNPPQYATADRPAYKKGMLIYDSTLGKLVVGGAAAWEVVTSV